MTDFIDADLRGSRFERVDLSGAELRAVDLSGARFAGVDLSGAVMRGVELANVSIYGELLNVTVNGVDIAPRVEAELNRRMPDRAKMRPADPAGFAEAAVSPARAYFEPKLGEFLLPYDDVRSAPDPDAALLAFLRSIPVDAEEAASRAALFPYRDDPTEGPPDQSGLDNQQIHVYHSQVIAEQDEQLDRLGESIRRQGELSIQIGEELDSHVQMLDGVDVMVDRHQTRLDKARKSLGTIARKANDNKQLTIIFVLIIILVLLIVILK